MNCVPFSPALPYHWAGTISRNGAERNGTELGSKIRNGTERYTCYIIIIDGFAGSETQVMFPGRFVLLEVVLVIVGICLPLVSYLSSYVSTYHPFLAGHMMWDGPNLGVYMLKGMLNGKRALAKSVNKQYGQYLWFFPKHIYWPYCIWTDLADYSSMVPV